MTTNRPFLLIFANFDLILMQFWNISWLGGCTRILGDVSEPPIKTALTSAFSIYPLNLCMTQKVGQESRENAIVLQSGIESQFVHLNSSASHCSLGYKR